jgi:enterochelin esterase-like enzyme
MSARKIPISSPRIAALQEALAAGDRAALNAFWQEVATHGAPLVELLEDEPDYRLVTFLWRDPGETENVVVIRGPAYWGDWHSNMLTHLPESDLWYKTYRLRSDTRTGYWLSPNDPLIPLREIEDMGAHTSRYQLDPLNPRTHTYPKDEEYPNDEDFTFSLLELPDAPAQHRSTQRPDVPQGKLELFRLCSEILDNQRRVWIYTPPGYETAGEPYNLLLVFDGPAYIHPSLVPVPTILDNLLHEGKLPPFVAVFPDSLTTEIRSRELPYYPPFVEFLTHELLPWVRARCHITSDPAHTIVAGSSYGGLAAAFAGFTAPHVFGKVLSQSGAFWYSGQSVPDLNAESLLIRSFVASPRLPLRFYLEVGLLEHIRDADMVFSNRHMRDVLEAKGYDVSYSEYMGGHDYICWRGSFADGLLALAGKQK